MFLNADEVPNSFEVDPGFAILASGGFTFGSAFSVEGEVGYRNIQAGPSVVVDEDIWSFFANAFYEISAGPMRPFVGAGVGLALVDIEQQNGFVFHSKDTGTSFAWQLIGGLAYPVTDNIELVADYRYTTTEGLELFGSNRDEDAHNITGGVRIGF